jgi:Protein of unknown function (DUF3108)
MLKSRVQFGTIAAACFAVVAPFAPAPAEAGPVAGRYQITMAGFSIGVATFDGMISSQGYQATLNSQLTGLAGVLSSGRGVVRVSGSFQGDRPVSNGYALAANNSQISRTIQIAMGGGNVGVVNIDPPFEPRPDRVPVLEHHRRGVLDPVSALMMPVAGGGELVAAESCNRSLPVFDGVQRFTIQLSYKEMRLLNEAKKGYVGYAVVCEARYLPVAGHRPLPSTTYMAENRNMRVWLVPVAGSQTLVPWRIEVQTQIGKLNIEAQSISGLAQDATASIRR